MASVGGVSEVGNASVIAISGLRAASLRLDVAANNLANVSTAGFVPARVLGSDLAEGGVRSTVATRQRQSEGESAGDSSDRSAEGANPPPDGGFPPASPFVDEPATSFVNPIAEIVNILLAEAAFLASLRALQHDTAASRHLMEILG